MKIADLLTESKILREKFKTQRKGSKGPAVKETQKMLIQLGHLAPTWTSKKSGKSYPSDDGNFGGGTAKAAMAFQKASGLDVDGIIGPATLKLMMGAVEKKTSSGLVAKHKPGIDAAKADRDATIAKVLDKREGTILDRLLAQKIKPKMKPRYSTLYPQVAQMVKAHGKNSVAGAEKMAKGILHAKWALDVNAMTFDQAFAEMLRRSTDMPEADVQHVTKETMKSRNEILAVQKGTTDAAVAKHGNAEQKARNNALNAKGATIQAQIDAIDNKVVDGVPVGPAAKADLEKKASARNAYDMAKGNVG